MLRLNMLAKPPLAFLGLVAMVSNMVSAQAQDAASDGSDAQCTALASTDFSAIQDAPTQVTGAKLVEAADDMPAYCRIEGYITPNVGIELSLPASQWNGKFIEVGCGGFCGSVWASVCDTPLRKGFACIASDMGHKSTPLDGKWAYNNLQAEVDFGFRATHVAALAGKAITTYYYARQPKRAYYMGCSTGGRQGLVAAQAFPWDFDGIVAGAPVINLSRVFMSMLWRASVLAGSDKKALFSIADLQLLHRSALGQCDRNDGLEDGVIGNPQACNFDPSALVCKTGMGEGCLSQPQADAMRKLYTGTTDSKGEIIFPGIMRGSEQGLDNSAARNYSFARDFFRYMGFVPDAGPKWQAESLDFDRDYKRFGMMEALYGGANPDLRRFKAAGGKLILYHGWNDGVPPLNTIDYHETVVNTMGGRAATQDFMRLFMVPGMGHCIGGDGAYAIDYVAYIDAWVEKGQAPDKIIGSHMKLDKPADAGRLTFPLDPAKIEFSRPVYPYPMKARYSGNGDPKDAASFKPVP